MAVLDGVPGLKGEILVGDQPLHEYNDEEEATPNEVTKYVEAQSGAEFTVRNTFSAPFPTRYGVEFSVSVDGARQRSYGEPDELYRSHGFLWRGMSHAEDGKRFMRNYRFTGLSIGTSLADILYFKVCAC